MHIKYIEILICALLNWVNLQRGVPRFGQMPERDAQIWLGQNLILSTPLPFTIPSIDF